MHPRKANPGDLVWFSTGDMSVVDFERCGCRQPTCHCYVCTSGDGDVCEDAYDSALGVVVTPYRCQTDAHFVNRSEMRVLAFGWIVTLRDVESVALVDDSTSSSGAS